MQMVRLSALIVAFAVALSIFPADTGKPEQKLAAVLIWGTDGGKPEDKDLKEVDPALREKFQNIFKWKNYYEVSRTNFVVKVGQPRHLKLSKKCEVKINQTQNEGMDVELFGETKSVYKGKTSMPLKDILVLAGPDKNATAWFVVLQPEKPE